MVTGVPLKVDQFTCGFDKNDRLLEVPPGQREDSPRLDDPIHSPGQPNAKPLGTSRGVFFWGM